MSLISRKLPDEKARRFVDSFLFTHLHSISVIDYRDILAETKKKGNQDFKGFQNILENMVKNISHLPLNSLNQRILLKVSWGRPFESFRKWPPGSEIF